MSANKVIEITTPRYQTTDDEEFDTKHEAIVHQVSVDHEANIKDFVSVLPYKDKHKKSLLNNILLWEQHKALDEANCPELQ